MDISAGIHDFLEAFLLILRSPRLRAWYFKRLIRAAVIGIFVLVFFLIVLAASVWALFQHFSYLLPADWMLGVLGVGLTILWGLGLYFTVGPVSLLFMNLLLSQFGEWKELRAAMPIQIHEFSAEGNLKSIWDSLLKALGLSLLIIIASIFAFFPILVFIPFLVAAYSLSKDWIWMTEEVFVEEEKISASASYCIGLGIIPAIAASIPILGVASLPVLQVACLKKYSLKS